MQRSIEGLRVTPWADWSEWWELKEMLSSGMVHEANERVQCYLIRRRQAVPVAMISTVSLRYQLDYPSPDEYSQRLGLAMAIVRFVNGMTDRLQPRGENAHAKSVHGLSMDLKLPPILVEIRHQASHNTLPQLSALESGARKALHWLHEYYWNPQYDKIRNNIERSTRGLRKVFLPRSEPELTSSEHNLREDELKANRDRIGTREKDHSSVLEDLVRLANNFGKGRVRQSNPLSVELDHAIDSTSQWIECQHSEVWKQTPIGLVPGQDRAPPWLLTHHFEDQTKTQERCSQEILDVEALETNNEVSGLTNDASEECKQIVEQLRQRDETMIAKMTSHYEKLLKTV